MTRKRSIAVEILDGIKDASAYLAGEEKRRRAMRIHVPATVNARANQRARKTSFCPTLSVAHRSKIS